MKWRGGTGEEETASEETGEKIIEGTGILWEEDEGIGWEKAGKMSEETVWDEDEDVEWPVERVQC